jgi:hypothetical protein
VILVPTLNCQVEIPEIKTSLGTATAEITVGRKFLLRCEGEWPDFAADKMELRLESADKYKLQLLEFQKTSSNQGQFLVTSYRAGEHHLKAVQVVDADHSVVLGDLSFTVKSVINPQEPETEPYGPIGPMSFGLPWWYFAALGAVILSLGVWIGIVWRRRVQKRKLIEEMKLSSSVLPPMSELFQKLRKVNRVLDETTTATQLSVVDEAFRIYFARKFQIPTLKWSQSLIMKDFKKNFPSLHEDCGLYVMKTFVELERARQVQTEIKVQDLEQLLGLVRKTSEMLEKERLS